MKNLGWDPVETAKKLVVKSTDHEKETYGVAILYRSETNGSKSSQFLDRILTYVLCVTLT